MSTVLHYLQSEMCRYKSERAQWELERAELRARVNFLHGERKAQVERFAHPVVYVHDRWPSS